MDIPRFVSINTARGAWSLVEDLGRTSAQPMQSIPGEAGAALLPPSGATGVHAAVALPAAASVGLEQVQQIVAQAAANVLGTDVEGALATASRSLSQELLHAPDAASLPGALQVDRLKVL